MKNRPVTRRTLLRYAFPAGAAAVSSRFGYSFPSQTDTGLITRAIPSTGEELPAIGMGTWQLGVSMVTMTKGQPTRA